MSISAKDVAELRKATGAGMMDCKKALAEANGDFDQAIEILRKKGQKVSASRADRSASEGTVFAETNSEATEAVIIQLNCETDFVARNDDFQELGKNILNLAQNEKPADLDALKALSLDGRAVSDHLTDAMGKIGEKIDVGSYDRVEGEKVIVYIHPGARVGVVVSFDGVNGGDVETVGKDVAMQIAAMHPIAIDQSDIPADVIEQERRIGREKALAEGKPENIVDKIAEGMLNKFYKESTLLNQEFVKDTSKNVGQYLKEANPNLKVKAFKRVQLGA